ncbi:hypothetical protein RRG08_065519 [Elysia crispata]|uniref:Uncharacterized protein n=1 Tax=Elysia crispata TaxID=231223 RepID=A0AAE0Z5N2_9GAST|nr:hypothetical protein RRG08_065519 [Elysia crispata]
MVCDFPSSVQFSDFPPLPHSAVNGRLDLSLDDHLSSGANIAKNFLHRQETLVSRAISRAGVCEKLRLTQHGHVKCAINLTHLPCFLVWYPWTLTPSFQQTSLASVYLVQ